MQFKNNINVIFPKKLLGVSKGSFSYDEDT